MGVLTPAQRDATGSSLQLRRLPYGLLKSLWGLATRDQILLVQDYGGHRVDARVQVQLLGGPYLLGKFVAGQNRLCPCLGQAHLFTGV